jgi:hypothetical protein
MVPMFRKNEEHRQNSLFGLTNTLPEKILKKARGTEEYYFYNLIFSHIDEEPFSVLFSDEMSRPNAPINCLVGAIILQNRRSWTFDELFTQLQFNILVRFALGLDDLETMPFCRSTLFNFQNRLSEHQSKTGDNLLECVFDRLTEKQLSTLKIKTSIQRTDSTFAASNIRNYSRLQLLVETLIRIERILNEKDSSRFKSHLEGYLKGTSEQYIYQLKSSDIPHELEQIAKACQWVFETFGSRYGSDAIFSVFERIFREQFKEDQGTVIPREPKELHSGCVQSPDDLDATYREKKGKKSKGQALNVVETAHPENPLNLITDVSVSPNNIDDSRILNERIDKLKEKTPDLNELHTDGAYGSEDNDRQFEAHQITHIQSDMRGHEASVPIDIEQEKEDQYTVTCPFQQVSSRKTRKRFKAEFDLNICSNCKHASTCPAIKQKKHRAFYFTQSDYLRKKRFKARDSIPPDRRKLRNNVEATIQEFTCKMPRGKLKVRGAFKAGLFAYSMAASVNFGRIYRYLMTDLDSVMPFFKYFQFFKERFLAISSFCKRFLHEDRYSPSYALI